MKRLIFLFVFMTIGCKALWAVPAYPRPVVYTQPDGDTLTLVMKGDELLKFAVTPDGYTLMYNAGGYFCYARQKANGDIEPSEFVAKSQSSRSVQEVAFLRSIAPGLHYSSSQVEMLKSIGGMQKSENSPQRAFPTTGSRKLLCILISFADVPFTRTQEEFNNLFNQVNYSFQNANGSVRDYFLEASYSQLDLHVDVAGTYTASQNMAYYGQNVYGSRDANPEALIREACNMADEDVDFSEYDNDGDGQVEGIYVIYAGYGEEAGASPNAIWAHKFSLTPSLLLDGVSVKDYSCSSELRDNIGNNITCIGVICHEFGHVLGAPDYYDTNYGYNGEFQGTGEWDLQSQGSWNDDGRTPPHPNPRTKIYTYNWATVTELNLPATVTMQPSINSSGSFYRINTNTNNEYFLIENRQQEGFDEYLPGHGLVIYRCHATLSSSAGSNNINTMHPQKFYPVSANATAAQPTGTVSSYGDINSPSCPWPGTGNKIHFTDATVPNMKSWNRVNTNKPITNISEDASGVITFDFIGGATRIITATAGEGGTIDPAGDVEVPYGESQTFTFTPSEGYHAVQVMVNNVNDPEAAVTGNYTFAKVTRNSTIAVVFANIPDGCNPPADLAVAYTSDCDAQLTWTTAIPAGPQPADSCTITVEMDDTAGDGWGGSKIVIADQSGTEWGTVACSGGAQTAVVTLPHNIEAVCYWIPDSTVNNRDSEVSFIITNAAGTVLYTCDANSFADRPEGEFTSFTNICESVEIPVRYNIYSDSVLIASDVETTFYTDLVFDPTYSHTWGVATMCTDGGESSRSTAFQEACDKISRIITAIAGEGGVIDPTGDVNVPYGESQTFTITPNEGYYISEILVDGVNSPEAVAAGSYTFIGITEHHTISATFAVNTFIIAATAGEGGTIDPTGDVEVPYDESPTFIITPNEGYRISEILIDGVNSPEAVAAGSYTFTSVMESHTISATFTVNTYVITATAGEGGIIDPAGDVEVSYGESPMFIFTPDDGYRIDTVRVDGALNAGAVLSGSYIFASVTTGHNIDVKFATISGIDVSILNGIKMYSQQNTVYIKNGTGEAIRLIEVCDITGRLVHSTATTTGTATAITLRGATGIYTVRLLLTSGKTVIRKTVLKTN